MSAPEAHPGPAETLAVFKKRPARGAAKFRKRAVSPPPQTLDESDSDDSSSSSTNEDGTAGQQIKRRKRNTGIATASSKEHAPSATELQPTTFMAERSATIKSSNDATKSSNWFDEDQPEGSSSLSAKSLLGSTRARPSFIAKNPNAQSRVVGPVKAPTNLRSITVTDFAPDVCKDYKQTGFCGFGDSCKYLHAREDYKHGWQLDREWETVTQGKPVAGGTKVASAGRRARADDADDAAEEDAAAVDGIPFACIICRTGYQNPIVTRCRHYFCEACALKRYRRNPSCAACGAGTGGVFNGAKGLKKLLDRKRDRARRRRERAREAGEEVSSAEDEEIEAEATPAVTPV